MISEWRCKEDGVLFAKIQDGQVSIRYKEVFFIMEGFGKIKAHCRKCGTENVLDLNNKKISA